MDRKAVYILREIESVLSSPWGRKIYTGMTNNRLYSGNELREEKKIGNKRDGRKN